MDKKEITWKKVYKILKKVLTNNSKSSIIIIERNKKGIDNYGKSIW